MNIDNLHDEHDLPTWMRQARQITDWGVVIVFFFSLMVAIPFIMQGDIPHTNDLENHVYMAQSYADALREGRLYPRWIQGALSGYGAPIGNYYPPATPYLIAVLELFFTNNTLIATRLVAIMAILLCGMMTYLFVLRLMRAEYAIIVALLYVYSPFIGMTVPYIMGDLPLLIASALFPMTLWSMGRVITCKNRLDGVILALLSAWIWLTHLEMAIVTHIILFIFLGMNIAIQRITLRRGLLIVIALLAGLGLSSFYWLPAWAEQDLVTWIRAPYTRLAPVLTLQNIIAPMTPIDLNQHVHLPKISIGWGIIVFVIGGIGGVFIASLYRRWWVFWGGCGIILLVVGVVMLPSALWLMTPITFCFAIFGSGSLGIFARLSRITQRLIVPMLIVVICLLALPVWLAPRWEDEGTTWDIVSQITHEQLGYGVAVLPPTRPIPITMPQPIVPNRSLLSGYLAENVVVRIPQNRLTVSKQAGLISAESHRDRYLIQTDSPATFEVLRAYAHGWRADLDGSSVTVAPNVTTGLMQVSVGRATNGLLTISYEATPIREWAWAVSGGVFVLVLFNILFGLLRDRRIAPPLELRLLSVQSARLIGIIIVGMFVFFGLLIVPNSPYSIYPSLGGGLSQFVGQNHKTDVGIEMLGYRVMSGDGETYAKGDTLRVQVAWRTARRLTTNYQVVVFLEDATFGGVRWLQSAPRYLAWYPTRRWSLRKYLLDEYTIPLTDALSVGQYRLVIEIYRCQERCLLENRVNFFTSEGELMGSQVALYPIFNVQ